MKPQLYFLKPTLPALACFICALLPNMAAAQKQKSKMVLQDIITHDSMFSITLNPSSPNDAYFTRYKNYLIIADHGLEHKGKQQCDVNSHSYTFLILYSLTENKITNTKTLYFPKPIGSLEEIVVNQNNLFVVGYHEMVRFQTDDILTFSFKPNPIITKFPPGSGRRRKGTIVGDSVITFSHAFGSISSFGYGGFFDYHFHKDSFATCHKVFIDGIDYSKLYMHVYMATVGNHFVYTKGHDYLLYLVDKNNNTLDSINFKQLDTTWKPLTYQDLNTLNIEDIAGNNNWNKRLTVLNGKDRIYKIHSIIGNDSMFVVLVDRKFKPIESEKRTSIDYWVVRNGKLVNICEDSLAYPLRNDSLASNSQHYFHWGYQQYITQDYVFTYANIHLNKKVRKLMLAQKPKKGSLKKERDKMLKKKVPATPCVLVYKIVN